MSFFVYKKVFLIYYFYMRKKISILICICVVIAIATTIGILFSHPQDISFSLIDEDELNFAHLEELGDSKMTLVSEGATNFDIVLDPECDDTLKQSALDLQDVVYKMSGATIDIVSHTSGKGIYIDTKASLDLSSVENDGFVIEIADNSISIQGVHYGASRNGVYHFAEEYLGAVFVSIDDTYVPTHSSVHLEKGRFLHNPAIVGREVYYYDLFDTHYRNKLKQTVYAMPRNSLIPISLSEVDQNCHSMYQYLSPEEYFETHPEYFSLKDGKRIYTHNNTDANLCLSNSEVYDIVEASLAKKIEENPQIKIWDFSLSDNWEVKGCECDNCAAMDKAAGDTGMGSLLPFVNKLARKFPQIYIKTLAYFHAEKAPTNIEVEKNVVITLCTMNGDQGCSYLDPKCANARTSHKLATGWAELSDNIVIWDYVIDFRHQMMPFPNLAVQTQNQEFYEQLGIRGVYHQGSRDKNNELCELRQYILSKLLWEGKDMNFSKEVSRYVQAFYGEAAPHIIKYLNTMHNELAKGVGKLGLYDHPYDHAFGYLSTSNLKKYQQYVNDALEAVEGNEKYTYRVDGIKLSVLYLELVHHSTKDEKRPLIKEQIDKICEARDVDALHEMTDYAYFEQNWQNTVEKSKLMFALPFIIGAILIVAIVAIIVVVKLKRSKKKIKQTP